MFYIKLQHVIYRVKSLLYEYLRALFNKKKSIHEITQHDMKTTQIQLIHYLLTHIGLQVSTAKNTGSNVSSTTNDCSWVLNMKHSELE